MSWQGTNGDTVCLGCLAVLVPLSAYRVRDVPMILTEVPLVRVQRHGVGKGFLWGQQGKQRR